MAYVPHIPDLDTWKKHFMDMAHDKLPHRNKFYVIGSRRQHGGSEDPVIQLVTPTQQAVEMAKSDMKRKAQEELNLYKYLNGVKKARTTHSTRKRPTGKTSSARKSKKGKKSVIKRSKKVTRRKR